MSKEYTCDADLSPGLACTDVPSFSVGSTRTTKDRSSKKSRTAPRVPDTGNSVTETPELYMMPPGDHYTPVKLTDVLPLVLCAGILALLYFMIREWHGERDNAEARMKSIDGRMEQLEKLLTSAPPKVLAPPAKEEITVEKMEVSEDDSEDPINPSVGGTYELSGGTVSYKPPGSPSIQHSVDSSDSENEEPPASVGKLPNLQSIDESDESGDEDGTFG
tara:strand:+ start:500 stop:1156 length:657 start_codon:yes stop_codon:yes gene_type:complete